MGIVYEALRIDDRTRVTVKLLSLGQGGSWQERELFERGAHVLQGLDHPGLPRVYDFEQDSDGRLVLVREALEGGTLEERIRGGRRLTGQELRHLLVKSLELLGYLEDLVPAVIHRDIKPANIMFRSSHDWEPVLIDFDTVSAPEAHHQGLTIVVSPGYTAPEQLAGGAVPASDLYSLGATMLFVVTHEHADELPHRDGRFDVDDALSAVPENVRRVLLGLVEPTLERRFHSARDALAALHTRPPRTLSPPSPEPHPREEDNVLADPVATEPARDDPPAAPKRVARRVLTVAAILASIGSFFYFVDFSRATLCSRADAKACERACRHSGCQCKTCKRKTRTNCNTLGLTYEYGEGVAKDDAKAAKAYRRACDLGLPIACSNLGVLQQKGGTPQDYSAAITLFRKACKQGEPAGCLSLGTVHEHGRGLPVDLPEAYRLYRLTCEKNYLRGCVYQADQLRDGKGVGVDPTAAVALLRRVCAQRPAKNRDTAIGLACYELARMYEAGAGAHASTDQIRESLRRGCELGEKRACRAPAPSLASGGSPTGRGGPSASVSNAP